MITRLPGHDSGGRAVAVYTALRLALFLLAVVLGALAGLRGFLLLVAALIVSGVLSWFLLARQRARMSQTIDGLTTRWRERIGARPAAEDRYVDELETQERVTHSDR